METSITYHTKNILMNQKLGCTIICMILLVQSIVSYYESMSLNAFISKPTHEGLVLLTVMKISWLAINLSLGYYRDIYFSPKLEKSSLKYFWNIMLQSDPEWLETQKNISKVVPDAVESINELIKNLFRTLRPLLTTISNLFALMTITTDKSIEILLSIAMIYLFGFYVIYYDFQTNKKIKVKTNDLDEYVRFNTNNFLISLLNGNGEKTIKEIIKFKNESTNIKLVHDRKTSKFYYLLEIVCLVVISYFTFALYDNMNGNNSFISLFYLIQACFNTTQWLIFQSTYMLKSCSSWGSIENFLKTYKLFDNIQLEMVEELELLKTTQEIQISGKSGDGKSTWMKRKVIELYNKYVPGRWLYLDQNMMLPKDNNSIYNFFNNVYKNKDMDLNKLYEYAKYLGIENIINEKTIYKQFNKPSGGETKRILILKSFMPILEGKSKVKYIFNDEITAGLDEENWLRVRTLIELLEEKGIKFVTIDHHPSFVCYKKYQVNKREREVKIKNVEMKKSFGSFVFSLFDKEDESNKEESRSEIDVWIDEEFEIV